MHARELLLCGALVMLSVLPAFASETAGTISSSEKYAWGENMGWINFAPDSGGLVITDSSVTGYAWSAVAGWINFNPTDSGQGVSNTPDGHLSGSAWAANLGWLDMSGVTITSSGRFTGTAGVEGSSAGRVSFDCGRCDVETDWRPASARTPSASTTPPIAAPSNGAPAGNTPHPAVAASSPHPAMDANANNPSSSAPILNALRIEPLPQSSNSVSAFNAPLTVAPTQTGQLVQTFGADSVVVDVPEGASAQALTVTIVQNPQPVDAISGGVIFIGGVVFDVVARDSSGAEVHHFDKPIRITLSIPEPLQGKDIGVYWLDETSQAWVFVPGVTYTTSSATFSVDHLTRFAILHAPGLPSRINISNPPSRQYDTALWLALALAGIIAIYLWVRRRKKS